MWSPTMLAGALVLPVSAACDPAGGNTGGSASVAVTATTVSTTSIATVPITTSAAATTGATMPSTTVAASTTSVVTSTTLEVGERADELLVVWASGVLAIHDPDTGRLLRVVATIGTDPQSVYGPVRDADGTTYMSVGFEDSWYSCEASQGSMIAVAPDGQVASVGPGGGPEISPDGMHLAYLRSSECRPDPAEPDLFVMIVTDTVVVRDLATAEERSWTFPGAFTDGSLARVVDSIAWHGDSVLAFVGGRLVRIDPSDPAVPDAANGTPLTLSADSPDYLALLGARSDGSILAQMNVEEPGETTLRIVTLDPATGRVIAEVAALQPTLPDVDPSGTRWVALIGDTVIVDGNETTLEPPPPPPGTDATYIDRPYVVGW